MVEVRDARLGDAWYIAMMMRDDDREELKAGGHAPLDAVVRGLRTSTYCKVAVLDDNPAIIFGVAPISALSGIGSPWLLGTDDLLKFKRQFIRECNSYVDEMLRYYPTLINYVNTRNDAGKIN